MARPGRLPASLTLVRRESGEHARRSVPVDEFHRVSAAFDESAGQLSAQDLQFSRRTVTVGGVTDGKLGHGPSLGVDEAQTDLAGTPIADRVLKAHAAQHLPTGTAHVDVLAAVPQRRCAFDDGRRETVTLQPVGKRGTGDARPADQDGSLIDGHSSSVGSREHGCETKRHYVRRVVGWVLG